MFSLNNFAYKTYDHLSLTLFNFTSEFNLNIPHFCYHSLLSIAGNCRVCMVEVIGNLKPVISCATMVMKGALVFTNSELTKCVRENVIEFLLINHPLDCPVCDQAGECDLQDLTLIYGGDRSRFVEKKKTVSNKFFNNIIKTTMTRCINCTRCIRYANEIAGVPVIATLGKGINIEIGNYINNNFLSGISGNIIDICPVGALNNKLTFFQTRNWELYDNLSTDLYDSLNQNIIIQTKENKVVKILPAKNNILNMELITDNARFFHLKMKNNRLKFPTLTGKYRIVKTGKIVDRWFISSWDSVFRVIIRESMRNKNFLKNRQVMIADDLLDGFDLLRVESESGYMKLRRSLVTTMLDKIFVEGKKNLGINRKYKDFYKIKNVFYLFLNLEKKNPLINGVLRINFYKNNFLSTNYVGIFFNQKYQMKHLFISLNELNKFFCNKLKIKVLFKNRFFDFFTTGIDRFSYKFFLFKLKFDNFVKFKNKYHYITWTSTELMAYNFGLSSINLKNKKHYNKIHYVGEHPSLLKFNTIKYIKFLIIQASHKFTDEEFLEFNKKTKFGRCVLLPVFSAYQNNGVYVNMFFKTQISRRVQNPIPGTMRNVTVFRLLTDLYGKHVYPYCIRKKWIKLTLEEHLIQERERIRRRTITELKRDLFFKKNK